MKTICIFLLATALSACGTVGGAMSGAGKDLSRIGEWVQSK